MNANSEAALIAKAIYLKSTDKLINSRECLNQIISLNSQLFYAWLVLSQIYYKLYCWEQTENASKQALQLMKPHLKDKLYHKVKLRLLEAMSRSNNKQKLIQTQQMCEEVIFDTYYTDIYEKYYIKLMQIFLNISLNMFLAVKNRIFCTIAIDICTDKCFIG